MFPHRAGRLSATFGLLRSMREATRWHGVYTTWEGGSSRQAGDGPHPGGGHRCPRQCTPLHEWRGDDRNRSEHWVHSPTALGTARTTSPITPLHTDHPLSMM